MGDGRQAGRIEFTWNRIGMCSSFVELRSVSCLYMSKPGDFDDQLTCNAYKREDTQSSCDDMSIVFHPCQILGLEILGTVMISHPWMSDLRRRTW